MGLQQADGGLLFHQPVEGGFGHRGLVAVSIPAQADIFRAGSVPFQVVPVDSLDEFREEPPYGRAVLDIALAQAAGGHAAQMGVILHQRHRASHARRGYGCCNTPGGAADDHAIELARWRLAAGLRARIGSGPAGRLGCPQAGPGQRCVVQEASAGRFLSQIVHGRNPASW